MSTNNPQVINIANNQEISLRDALEVLPIFTRENISLDQFIKGCREASDMLPARTEQNSTKLIKTKIKGEARICITRGQYNNVGDIISNLEQIYSLNKSFFYGEEEKCRSLL